MAVTISGSDGISGDLPTIKVGNGSESAPAVTGQDTDTGLFFGTNEIKVSTGGTQAITVDSSQKVGIGTSSPDSKLTVAADSAAARLELQRTNAAGEGSYGAINFTALDDHSVASIHAKGDGDADDNGAHLVFRTTSAATSNDPYAISERMRITSENGDLLVGKTSANSAADGCELRASGLGSFTRSSNIPLLANRNTNDGTIVTLRQNNTQEGTISVSGSTVSYNGGHLSRWSQLAGGAERTAILRGSVLSNLDEMCEWGEEDNEQLNRMKVSDVEGDVNVSGVFMAWDDDDDTYTNDFYCSMTGDFVIRIAQGTTVARGDLLMSAGDGTAKPQDDDIVRSKTIAKVTSTVVSETYADGSYCVPCVLMAC